MSDLTPLHEGQATKPSSLLMAILGAVGGAALTLGGQVALEIYKGGQEQQAQILDRAERHHAAYNEFGDLSRRAGVFANGGHEGTKDEVRTIARHFRQVSSDILLGRVDKGIIAGLYGGQLVGWSRRFNALGNGGVHAEEFDESDREIFRLLAVALADIAAVAPAAAGPHADVSAVTNSAADPDER